MIAGVSARDGVLSTVTPAGWLGAGRLDWERPSGGALGARPVIASMAETI